MGKPEIERFLSHLAINKTVSASTQNQAFPASQNCRDPRSGEIVRHHLHESALGRSIAIARKKAGIEKRFSTHVMRHCFATHMLEDGVNISTVQTLLGHKDVKTTEIYTHVMDKSFTGVISPLLTLASRPGSQ